MDNQHNESKLPQLELDNLKAIKVLGKGAMGTVFLVHDNSTNPCNTSPFALKVVEKSLLPPGKSDPNRRARWEISVLSRLQKNPFLPSLLGSIETQEFIGWAMPFCPGNDLNALRFQQADHVFSPSIIRFYLAEIICALENLHNMGIVYRDLKPENILIQESGHVTLTDFDLSCNLAHAPPSKLSNTTNLAHAPPSKFSMTTNLAHTQPSKFSKTTKLAHAPPKLAHSPMSKSSNTAELAKNQNKKKPKSARVSPMNKRNVLTLDGRERSYSFVGTEEYVAPEIIRGEGHEFAVDWWALGVLAYEMLYGTSPFKGKNRKETYQRTVAAQPVFPGKLNVLTDLIQKLLEKDPTRRLGYYGGACEIKEHEFFKGLKWDLLTEVVRPPFIPSRQENDVMECGIDFKQYFQELKVATSFDVENCNVSLTEF